MTDRPAFNPMAAGEAVRRLAERMAHAARERWHGEAPVGAPEISALLDLAERLGQTRSGVVFTQEDAARVERRGRQLHTRAEAILSRSPIESVEAEARLDLEDAETLEQLGRWIRESMAGDGRGLVGPEPLA